MTDSSRATRSPTVGGLASHFSNFNLALFPQCDSSAHPYFPSFSILVILASPGRDVRLLET